jgi:hypothetical protein
MPPIDPAQCSYCEAVWRMGPCSYHDAYNYTLDWDRCVTVFRVRQLKRGYVMLLDALTQNGLFQADKIVMTIGADFPRNECEINGVRYKMLGELCRGESDPMTGGFVFWFRVYPGMDPVPVYGFKDAVARGFLTRKVAV